MPVGKERETVPLTTPLAILASSGKKHNLLFLLVFV